MCDGLVLAFLMGHAKSTQSDPSPISFGGLLQPVMKHSLTKYMSLPILTILNPTTVDDIGLTKVNINQIQLTMANIISIIIIVVNIVLQKE